MLRNFSDLIGNDNPLFLTLAAATIFALLVGIGLHEACHAFTATALGDTLPRRQHRTTLNPFAHLDPFGTFMMLFVGFGWGKPVQFQPYGLKVKPRMAMLLVSAAGPASNFVTAFLLSLPLQLGWVDVPHSAGSVLIEPSRSSGNYIAIFLLTAVYLNVILGVFNLIPIHPLDGFKVVLGLLPDDLAEQFASLAQYGPGMLMTLLVLPLVAGYLGYQINPLADIMAPTAQHIVQFLSGIH